MLNNTMEFLLTTIGELYKISKLFLYRKSFLFPSLFWKTSPACETPGKKHFTALNKQLFFSVTLNRSWMVQYIAQNLPPWTTFQGLAVERIIKYCCSLPYSGRARVGSNYFFVIPVGGDVWANANQARKVEGNDEFSDIPNNPNATRNRIV